MLYNNNKTHDISKCSLSFPASGQVREHRHVRGARVGDRRQGGGHVHGQTAALPREEQRLRRLAGACLIVDGLDNK